MKQLRAYGIYNLPGVKRRFHLVPDEQDTYSLYDSEFGARLPPRFRILNDGLIVNWFNDFPVWTADDLIDTGKVFEK